jgi:hypothetical protein
MSFLKRLGPAVSLVAASLFIASAGAQEVAGGLNDAIVGTWVGEATQGDSKFETRLTFVSPKGGVSRYPSFPCGGILSGDRKGDGYEYNEVVTWGGTDEKPTGCIGGVVRLVVEGDTMKFDWSTNYNGQDLSAAGELRRVTKR